MPERWRTAPIGRTAVIAVYLVTLALVAPTAAAVVPALLLGGIWLAAHVRDTARRRVVAPVVAGGSRGR